MVDAAIASIAAHGFSCLALAVRMSLINGEQMKVARMAAKTNGNAREAAVKFLKSTYYKSWSRAQLNNTEYAPMLSICIFCIKYNADRAERPLTMIENVACLSSVVFSYIFIYAAATQGRVNHAKMRPGRAGFSPLRPLGALGRYISFGALIFCLLKSTNT